MDKLTKYGEIIKRILTEYYQIVEKSPDFQDENCLIFDDNNHHYFWRSIDWVNQKRVNNTHIYVRIKKLSLLWLKLRSIFMLIMKKKS